EVAVRVAGCAGLIQRSVVTARLDVRLGLREREREAAGAALHVDWYLDDERSPGRGGFAIPDGLARRRGVQEDAASGQRRSERRHDRCERDRLAEGDDALVRDADRLAGDFRA